MKRIAGESQTNILHIYACDALRSGYCSGCEPVKRSWRFTYASIINTDSASQGHSWQ